MFKVTATTNKGQELCSYHKTKEEAILSKKCCFGRYPYGNRVKITEVNSLTKSA